MSQKLKGLEKTSCPKNYKDLIGNIWMQDSQYLKMLRQFHLENWEFCERFDKLREIIFNFSNYFAETIKTTCLENYKDFGNHNWRQDSQSLKTQRAPNTGSENSRII